MRKYLYFTPDAPQERLGLYITVAGHETFKPDDEYPPRYQKSDYYYEWKNGRRLPYGEYQLFYVNEGHGITQFKKGRNIALSAGTVNILRPGEWHRHRPDGPTGWHEAYLGIGGEVVKRVVDELFSNKHPIIIKPQHSEKFKIDLMTLIEDILAAGTEHPHSFALKALALLASLGESDTTPNGGTIHYAAIRRACLHIGHHLGETLDLRMVAKEVGMGYPLFRLRFRECTGLSPLAYQLSMRIRRAAQLLADTDTPIAQLASDLGFQSSAYFARFFHKAMGRSPRAYRLQQRHISSRS